MKKSLFSFLAAVLTATTAMAQYNMHDLNHDGSVNTADVVKIYNYIINGDNDPDDSYEENLDDMLDLNHDGSVNTADVVKIYNYIINGDYYDENQDGHKGNSHIVKGNQLSQVGGIVGTPWQYEQWGEGGSYSMTYYDNGTFQAQWQNVQDYIVRVGYMIWTFPFDIDRSEKYYTADYKYTKTGSASYSYIGAYGWSDNPMSEFYIVDDWYGTMNMKWYNDHYHSFGTYTADGATYTLFVRLQKSMRAINSSTTDFFQIISIRNTPRQEGHMDINAHFAKWDEFLHGQQVMLPTSGNSTEECTMTFGSKLYLLTLYCEAGGATGSIDYTYFNLKDEK